MQARTKDDLAPVWRALANPIRREILDILSEEPLDTGGLAAYFPKLSRFAVMQHLRVLEKARLIISKKEGRCRWNYLDVSPIQRIHERWIQAYAMPSANMLSKLQQDLETL